jgi:TolB-like protein/DNA-binding winged helix-turn-helix (wHTH) protein/Tfp pilus assembly protein PilF
MVGEPSRSPLVQFGPFELDRRTGELRRSGTRIALQGQPVRVLTLLLERPGDLVTRDELRQRLWADDTFVDFEHGLNAAVRRLREALGDSAETPRFVETLPRRGYRFIAAVQHPDPPPRRLRGTLAVGVTLLVLAGVVAVLWQRRGEPAEAHAPIRTIAVLPFRNLSGTPGDDLFAEGLTEAVTTDLASISSLRVLSRQSVLRFQGSTQSAGEIARLLGADALILGTVARSGGQVRLTAQLVDGTTDQHLWADRYQRPITDVLAVQGELARAVAGAIRATVSDVERAALMNRRTIDPEAYALYLRGRHLVSLRDEHVVEGIDHLERSIAGDPTFAPAYGTLAVAYVLRVNAMGEEGRRRALEAADQALALDPRQPEALVARAMMRPVRERDWTAAEREFARIVAQSPSHELAHSWYGTFLLAHCRSEEGLAQRRLALRLDPLSNAPNNSMGVALAMEGRFDESVAAFRRALELDPNYADAHGWLGWTLVTMGRTDEGIAEMEAAVRIAPEDARMRARLAHGYGLAGREADARRLLADLAQRAQRQRVPPLMFAHVHAALGDADHAFAQLEAAFAENGLVRLADDPLLFPLYDDPRFAQLLRRMNLPGPCAWGARQRRR